MLRDRWLGPGDIVLNGDPAPLPQLNSTQLNEHLWTQVIKHLNVHIYLARKGHSTPPLLNWPKSIVAKWLDGSGYTWYGGRPRPRRHYITWGPSSPTTRKGAHHRTCPTFRPCPLWPNGRQSQQLLSYRILHERRWFVLQFHWHWQYSDCGRE